MSFYMSFNKYQVVPMEIRMNIAIIINMIQYLIKFI